MTTQQTPEAPALLNRKEAAAWLGISVPALAQLNYKGTGPKFIVVGARTVRYRMSDLVEYVDGNVRTQTGSAA